MIKTILLGKNDIDLKEVEDLLIQYCPSVQIMKEVTTFKKLTNLKPNKKPKLVIIILTAADDLIQLAKLPTLGFEFIFLANTKEFAFETIPFQPISYLLTPIKTSHLITAVSKAQQQINSKAAHIQLQQRSFNLNNIHSQNNRLSIATQNGLAFIIIKDLVRIEAMERCTRLVLKNGQEFVSSTNIGAFKKLLTNYPFFLTHKSHLINFEYIKYYNKDGTISMIDGAGVPLSLRQKPAFLEVVRWAK